MFKIGRLFHVIHICDDLKAVDDWYDRVFAVKRTFKASYSPLEKRDASFGYISDFCMEPMAPSKEAGAEDMAVGKFHRRFGNHYQSIAWYVREGFPEFFDNLNKSGVRLYTDGGTPVKALGELRAAVYTHPRDTKCQWEMMPYRPGRDDAPRSIPGWSEALWRDQHPLGILPKSWHATIAVRDVKLATDLYSRLLNARVVHQGKNDVTESTSAFVAVGEDSLVELAQPASSGSLIARDMERCGEIFHAVTLRVKDIKKAEQFIKSQGIRTEHRGKETFLMDPADTFGAPIYLSERAVPGDPR